MRQSAAICDNNSIKIASLALGLALFTAPAFAQVSAPNVAPLAAPKMATVTPFITGLKEPRGMIRDVRNAKATLLVCDYGTGEILGFDVDGKPLGVFAKDLEGPTAIETHYNNIFVTESKANHTVVIIDGEGKITPVGRKIFNPFIRVKGPSGLLVISPATSKIYRWNSQGNIPTQSQLEQVYSAPSRIPWITPRQGLGETCLLTDEISQRIVILTEGGKIVPFDIGNSKPSSLLSGPNGTYIANEGDGGQLIRINNNGQNTVVAEKLGRPSGILCLDAKTLLVSNRDGNIWKIVLP